MRGTRSPRLWYLRALPLTSGTSFEMPINEAGRNMTAVMTVGPPETIDALADRSRRYRIEPRLTTRVQRRQAVEATIWISTDARRVPLGRRHHGRIRPRATEASRLPSVIETQSLTKMYGREDYALRDLTLKVEKGEFAFLTGPSGAGKSTLLRLLLMQERPTAGSVIVGDRDLSTLSPSEIQDYRRTIGFVFQDFKLIASKTIFENVAFVLRVLGQPVEQQRRRTYQVLKWVGLQHRHNAYPLELSGGEQQRVAVARALVNEPHIVLADEPTGNLDPDLSLEIMNLFRDINASGTTVLVATHDRELIQWVGRRVIQLEQGRLGGTAEPAS